MSKKVTHCRSSYLSTTALCGTYTNPQLTGVRSMVTCKRCLRIMKEGHPAHPELTLEVPSPECQEALKRIGRQQQEREDAVTRRREEAWEKCFLAALTGLVRSGGTQSSNFLVAGAGHIASIAVDALLKGPPPEEPAEPEQPGTAPECLIVPLTGWIGTRREAQRVAQAAMQAIADNPPCKDQAWKIRAIKQLRAAAKLSLKDAKTIIELAATLPEKSK